MTIDFSTLRGSYAKPSEALKRAMSKDSGGFKEDPRIWKYTRDEKNNISSSVIRFLGVAKVDHIGANEGRWAAEDLTPLVKLKHHRFEGKNGWFHGYTRDTFGEDCPVKDWSIPQWGALKGLNKEDPTVKAQREYLKRFIAATEYYAGILVISDMQVPENNGKVFLFKFGEGIKAFLDLAEEPKFPNQPKFDPFNPWTGANLHLDLTFEKRSFKGKDSYVPKFDQVRWSAPCAMGEDSLIEQVWEQQHSLMEFLLPEKFLTYDQAKEKLMKVMNLDENLNPVVGGQSNVGRTVGDYSAAPAPAPAASAPAPAPAQHTGQAVATAPAAPAPAPAAAAPAQSVQDEDPVLKRLRMMQAQQG